MKQMNWHGVVNLEALKGQDKMPFFSKEDKILMNGHKAEADKIL